MKSIPACCPSARWAAGRNDAPRNQIMKYLRDYAIAALCLITWPALANDSNANSKETVTLLTRTYHDVDLGVATNGARHGKCKPDYDAGYVEGNDDALDVLIRLGARM
jgi:hypothetical protein